MYTTIVSDAEYEKMINSAIPNLNLEWYGSFSFENMQQILGSDKQVNLLLTMGFFDYYAIPMTGITGGVHGFVTLNDRWRKLKRCGSYQALLGIERIEKEKEEKREIDADLFVQYQKENAQWQKENNPLIKQTNQSTIDTNNNTITTNASLKRIFMCTAIIAMAGTLIAGINTYRDFRKDTSALQLHNKDSLLQVKDSEISRLTKDIDSLNHLYQKPQQKR